MNELHNCKELTESIQENIDHLRKSPHKIHQIEADMLELFGDQLFQHVLSRTQKFEKGHDFLPVAAALISVVSRIFQQYGGLRHATEEGKIPLISLYGGMFVDSLCDISDLKLDSKPTEICDQISEFLKRGKS